MRWTYAYHVFHGCSGAGVAAARAPGESPGAWTSGAAAAKGGRKLGGVAGTSRETAGPWELAVPVGVRVRVRVLEPSRRRLLPGDDIRPEVFV